jgi:hypothetical protein
MPSNFCIAGGGGCGPGFWLGVVAGRSGEPSLPECRDLIRGLLQLHPHARLGLQQVAAHHWMLPAAQELFSVLGAVPGGAWPTVEELGSRFVPLHFA